MEIIWLGHASFEIKINGKVIYIDPYFGEYNDKADIVLISHGHYDHSSIEKVGSVMTDETVILTTPEVASTINGAMPMTPGQIEEMGDIKVKAVSAYNLSKKFHPKGYGLGFIITAKDKSIYFAGDTDRIPEMKSLKADIVLLPVGGTYTMDAEEASKAVLDIKPKIAIPMHYGSGVVGKIEDAELFKEMVESTGNTEVVILEQGKGLEL